MCKKQKRIKNWKTVLWLLILSVLGVSLLLGLFLLFVGFTWNEKRIADAGIIITLTAGMWLIGILFGIRDAIRKKQIEQREMELGMT